MGRTTKQPVKKRNQSKAKNSKAKPTTTAIRKQEKPQATTDAQERAKKAAILAQQLFQEDPEKAKALLHKMALGRESPRSAPQKWRPKNSVIPNGFVWVHYPPLETGKKSWLIIDYHPFIHSFDTRG